MKKRLILHILLACLLLTALSPVAYAAETAEDTAEETTEAAAEETTETEAEEEENDENVSFGATSGTCGDGLTWELQGSTLTISGSGEMDSGAPWEGHKDEIRKVIFSGGVTTVGAEAFAECENLTAVDFGGTMREIDTAAFKDCTGLTSISLPATFRRFGQESFMGCTNLEEIYCAGGMPSFNGNCLWNGNYITIYRPVDNPWPQEAVEQLVSNFGGRLEIMAASIGGNVPAATEKVEETQETTEATTEPTTAPTTEPVETTEATTEPTAEPTTVPTEAPETVPEIAEMPTAPEEMPEEMDGFNWLWLILVPAGLAMIILTALIIRIVGGKEGRYRE